jgi:hypothetical protein
MMQIDQMVPGAALPTADAVVSAGLGGDFGPALWGTIREGDMAGPGDLAPQVDAVLGPLLLEGQLQPPWGLYPGTLPGDHAGHIPEPPVLWLLLGLLVPVILWRVRRAYVRRRQERLQHEAQQALPRDE